MEDWKYQQQLYHLTLEPNDKFFVPYTQDKKPYDEAIQNIDLSFKNVPSQVDITIDFFKKEFFINTYKINL